jgi:hypothetical protein
MGMKKLALLAALGLSMASAPVMAQTSAVERSGATLQQASAQDDDDAMGGGTTTYVIAFFVIVVIAIGIYFAIDDDEDGRATP